MTAAVVWDVLWVAFILCAWAAAVALYFAPAIIAVRRRVPNRWSVVVVNVLLGWTVVGWAVALAMAVRDRPARQTA